MSLHIEFCLDEIDFEIEAALDNALDDVDRISLKRHVEGIRAIIAFARMRSAAQQNISHVPEDDLTLVQGIGLAEQKILYGAGVRTFSAIADWRLDDIKALAQHGISLERIACENWIEQAAVLALGSTSHSAMSALEGRAVPLEGVPQVDTVATVVDQTETLSEIQTEVEADGCTSILASEPDCGAQCAISTEIIETPLITAVPEKIPDEPVPEAPLPTAAVSAAPLEGVPQVDTVATVVDQTETLSDIQTESEVVGSSSTLASEKDCGAECATSTDIIEITETPQSTSATEPISDEHVEVALLPTAALIPFETVIKSRRQMSARPFRRVAVAAAALVLTTLGVGFIVHQQLGDLPAMMVSSLNLSTK